MPYEIDIILAFNSEGGIDVRAERAMLRYLIKNPDLDNEGVC